MAGTRENEDFDVLKFFITVMVLLTTFVAGYAIKLRMDSRELSDKIVGQIRTLGEMKKIATDPPFREWVARERESKSGDRERSPTDFKALVVSEASKFNLNLTNYEQQSAVDHRVVTEIPFKLIIENCRVEDLTRYLAHIEESWGGAKARQISQLDWDDKKQAWKAQVILSIFRATGPG